MQLKYGTYTHAVNDATVQIARQTLWNEGKQAYGYLETWTITGFLQAASQAALTTAIATLKLGYLQQGVGVALLDNNGALTSHVILANQAVGGVRVTRGPEFPKGDGAEYSTYRSYTIQLEAEIRDPTVRFLAWTESLTFSGGGPRRLFLQTLTGLPQEQITAQSTPYTAVQQGMAIGQLTWPVPPAPQWPGAEHRPLRRIEPKAPKRFGLAYVDYEITWYYAFESAVPLVSIPTPWPLP